MELLSMCLLSSSVTINRYYLAMQSTQVYFQPQCLCEFILLLLYTIYDCISVLIIIISWRLTQWCIHLPNAKPCNMLLLYRATQIYGCFLKTHLQPMLGMCSTNDDFKININLVFLQVHSSCSTINEPLPYM